MQQSPAQYNMRISQEGEYPEEFTSEQPYLPIQPSTLNAFTVNFEIGELMTNCDPNFSRMTPCLDKKYDEMFGSGYNDVVRENYSTILCYI